MTNIINFEDYRAPEPHGPVDVTFIGFVFKDEAGTQHQLNVTFQVQNGDFDGAIRAVRDDGGCYLPQSVAGAFYFLPWPPAAVRVKSSSK